jgi:capreomycidine synthase
MKVPPAPLEDWLRDYYFTAEIDISSSGVQPYTMADVRAKTGLRNDEVDALEFRDGFSVGAPAVRAAIARRWGDGDPDKVMTTNGSSEAISLVLMSLLRPGDEVIVVQPGYHLLVEFAVGLDCVPRTWHLEAGDCWRPSPDSLAELVNNRTRAIIVNFPQNPTGASISESELSLLVSYAERAGAYVMWDAAFAELTYEADPLPDISKLYSRGISFGTFSKVFGLPGLRFGWCIGPSDVLCSCVRIRDYTTLHVSPLVELLALRVLENADSFIKPRLEQARTNRLIVREWAEASADQISLTLPVGGVAAFPRLEGLTDTWEFCEALLEQHGVLVVPGSCFGCPSHIRLGFGGETEKLRHGLDRLGTALAAR